MAISDKQAVERRTMMVARELMLPGGMFSLFGTLLMKFEYMIMI